jgi:hypothetical protein
MSRARGPLRLEIICQLGGEIAVRVLASEDEALRELASPLASRTLS